MSMCLIHFPEKGVGIVPLYLIFRLPRVKDASAICDLAMENYEEMSTKVVTLSYRAEKMFWDTLWRLSRGTAHWATPQYTMVSFTQIPYSEVVARRNWQRLVMKLCILPSLIGITAAFVAITGRLIFGGRRRL